MTRTTSLYETCENLFGQYPLAVNDQAIILMLEDNGEPAFYALDGYGGPGYVLRAWHGPAIADIGADDEPPATGEVAEIVTQGVPLPRNGSFFGWKRGRMITAAMTIYAQYSPETPVPGWAVSLLEGAPDSQPPFTALTLADSSFWDHYRDGNIVDLGPLVAASPGAVFWAHPATLTYPCCAVARDITSPDGWVLPQGCYVWWQSLRDGETAGPLDAVLAGDVTDVSPRFRQVA
jgi:hypothetical protein